MKRSQAVFKLINYINNNSYHMEMCDLLGDYCGKCYKHAEKALTFIETELKMLPPTYRHEDGDLGSWIKNMWEPEE